MRTTAVVLLATLALCGCGGGGDSDDLVGYEVVTVPFCPHEADYWTFVGPLPTECDIPTD